ncbi:MAG: T9SS type A sorting domain-containing protein [Chitinophagaceae bacterium]|nr:T9SS type A sorting domain-containing protein [Chitinophagaceae bacterium]
MTKLVKIYCLSVVFILFISCNSDNHRQEKVETDGMELAMRQEFMMTRDPALNIIPRERLNAARYYMESIDPSVTGRLTALAWQERGPSNVGGRTRAIMIDKRDASGNTVFAGSVSGGMFKTTNFLSTPPAWTPVNDFLPNLAITAIVQNPVNMDTMYAATGEGWFNIDAVRGGGIYRSINGGTTWTLMASTNQFEYVQDFVIDNSGNLYASLRNFATANRGVMRSTDRGATWTQVLGAPLPGFETGRATDLEIAANGDIYAALGIFGRSVVMKSSFATHGANTGAAGNWVNITPTTPTITQRTEILVAPSDAQRVYLLMQDSATLQVLNIFRSTNGGTNWTTLTAPNLGPQTWYNLIGAVDPSDADILIIGGLNLTRSTNAGDNWSTSISGGVHVDHHALIFDGSSKLINGNDGGIYYSTNANTASPAFANKNSGYNVTQYYGCDAHPSAADYFLAGSQDNGTQRFTTPGVNNTTNATGGDGGFCHIDQTDGQLQITSNTGNIYNRSLNGGGSFSSLGAVNNSRGQFINPTDMDDVQKVLYCGDDPGRYYCITNLTGTPAGQAISVTAMGTRSVTAVKVDPFAPNTIWLGASIGTTTALVPMVLKISNANTGTPNVQINVTVPAAAGAAISSIDIDPANANHILVTLSNFGVVSVWESTDGGNSYSGIEGNLPDMPIRWGLFAPSNAQLNGTAGGNGGIMLGTELGVWTTSQIAGAATQWIPNNSGLANVRTDMLKYRPGDNTVVAATHGRGLFTTTVPTVVTGIDNPTNTTDFIKYISADKDKLLIVPGKLQVKTMTITLFNAAGQRVKEMQTRYQSTTIPISDLPTGVYIVKCTGDKKENFIQKFSK